MARDLEQRVGSRVAQRGSEQPQTLAQLIEKMKPELGRALPRHMDPDRLARIALTVLRQTPKLQECNPQSFLGALMTSAQLGLEPGPLGEAYLVPFGREVTFIPGYRGLVKLAWQSGQLDSIAAHVVHESDEFDFAYGLEPTLVHKPSLGIASSKGRVIAAYAVATFKHGGNAFEIMSYDDIEAIRRRSKTPNNGPWKTDWEAMARKTVVKQLAKWLPLSPEFADAIVRDGSVRTDPTASLDDVPVFIEGEVDGGQLDPADDSVSEPVDDSVPPPEDPQAQSNSGAEKKISAAQLKALHAAFGGQKITDRQEKLDWLGNLTNREITSTEDLTATEASLAIDTLK